MRSVFLLLAFITLAAVSNAQPTFTADNLPSAGSSVTWTPCDTNGISPGASGANVTWDFSSVTTLGDAFSLNYTTPAASPYASSFPSASLAEESDTAWSYYKLEGGRWTRLGEESDAFQSGPWADPLDIALVPWTYGETLTDNAAHTMVIQSNTVHRKGSINAKYDGYGTIILPTGTFTNAIRIGYTQIIRDSFQIVAGPFTINSISVVEIHAWTWHEAGNDKPLFSVDSTYVTITTDGPAPMTQKRQFTRCQISDAEGGGGSTAPAPSPLTPDDMARIQGVDVELSWTKDEETDQTRVMVAYDADFTESVLDLTTSASKIVAGDLDLGVMYYWRLQTVRGGIIKKDGANVQENPWSATRTFTTIPVTPTLVSPEDGTGTQILELTWTATTDSSDLQASTTSDFANPVLDVRVAESSYSPGLPFGQYYWRVRGVAPTGVSGEWTEPWSFVFVPLSVIEWSTTNMTVGPNPASTDLRVVGSDLERFSAYEIVALDGSSVLRDAIPSGSASLDISLNGVAAGTYLLVLKSADNVTPVNIVIQK